MPALRRIPALALVAAAALPAAGCEEGGPPARARDGRVAVTLDDFFIAPQRIRARPGRVEFRAVNRGAIGLTERVFRAPPPLLQLVAV